jgi:hypothetical protein
VEKQITAQEREGKRVTIDLSPAASDELDRLRNLTHQTTASIFRTALTLFRLYVKAKAEGKDVVFQDPRHPEKQTQLEFPIQLHEEAVQ